MSLSTFFRFRYRRLPRLLLLPLHVPLLEALWQRRVFLEASRSFDELLVGVLLRERSGTKKFNLRPIF
jgi:hypothetical protein